MGKGERQCGKGISRVALPLGQHPSPWDEMLGSGPGARVHTHTHTHHTPEAGTRLLSHTYPAHMHTHTPHVHSDAQGHQQHTVQTRTHASAHSTDTFTLRLQNVGLGEGGGLEPPSQRPPPQYVPETPFPGPSSTKFMGPNTVSVRDV